MDQASGPQYEADFSIALRLFSGLRRYPMIDWYGSVAISDGRLMLRKSTGEIIVEAPVSEVRAYTVNRGKAVDVLIGDKRYHLGPLRREGMTHHGVFALINAYREHERLKEGKQSAKRFMEAFAAAGGRVGKP
jgi:hypothetical protein